VRTATYTYYRERVACIIQSVHENLDEPLSIGDLAARACMSPFHFQRVFNRVAGENCGELVRRMRLERAAWQLQTTSDRIADIALRAGFDSQEAFARAFRCAYGSPATEFREARWLTYRLLCPSGAHFTPDGSPGFEPLAAFGQGVPFEIRRIEPFQVAGRVHHGSPHLIEKSLRSLVEELRPSGFDPLRHPMLTFALGLGPKVPASAITSYVAIPTEFARGEGFQPATLGGGPHLVASHVGTGGSLGDFWIRMWAEALPASGCKLREGRCFQILGFSAPKPAAMQAGIFIPVHRQKRIFDQSN